MVEDEIKRAERRGYSKGYVAGKRRKQAARQREVHCREQQAFLDRAFLVILPVALAAEGWKFGDKPISTTEERVLLAKRWAEEALRQRPIF